MRCRSPPAPPAHGAQVGYFLAAGVFFAVVLRAAGFRVVLLRVVLVSVALAATAGTDDAAASPVPSAAESPPASPVPSAPLPPSELSPPSVLSVLSSPPPPAAAAAFFTTRARRSISFFTPAPASSVSAWRNSASAVVCSSVVPLRSAKARALQSLARTTSGISLPAVNSATSSSTARYGVTSVVSSA